MDSPLTHFARADDSALTDDSEQALPSFDGHVAKCRHFLVSVNFTPHAMGFAGELDAKRPVDWRRPAAALD